MTPDEYLDSVAKDLYDAKRLESDTKKTVTDYRDEFFRMADEMWRSKDHLLPVQTVEVPKSFFDATGMSQGEFVKSRYPGWEIEHVEYNTVTEQKVFVLKRDPHYLGRVVEVETGHGIAQVAKEVSEYAPEVDWETLRAERPDLFDRLAVPRTVYDVSEEELERLFQETPEEAAALKRHLKVREPTLRATARKVKSERKS